MDKGIIDGIDVAPDEPVMRNDFAKMIMRIMAYNPKSIVYKYVEQFSFFDKDKLGTSSKPIPKVSAPIEEEPGEELLEIPLKTTSKTNTSSSTSGLHAAANSDGCLVHEPNRILQFSDVSESHWAYPSIEVLRTSKIEETGDFIASGQGNPSVGKQAKYESGSWEFRPEDPVNFFEMIKVALVANCIPIDDKIVAPDNGFEFRMLPLNTSPADEQKYFAARVMYTGYNNGVIRGDIDPFSLIKRFEALVILARGAGIEIPKSISKPLPFPDTDDKAWYAPYVEYFHNKGVVNGNGDGELKGHHDLKRGEMAKMLAVYIKTHNNSKIRDYGRTISNYYDIK